MNISLAVKAAIASFDPEAEVVLYGSRARGNASPESDWDFLVILSRPMAETKIAAIRRALYDIEWDSGEIVCPLFHSRQEWEDPVRTATPFNRQVSREGVTV